MSTPVAVKPKKSWPKKLGIAAGVFFGLLLLAMIVVPLVVDVDSYRPQIVQTANEKINGKLEMGKLTLSLWGQIKVVVDGFSLTDSAGRKVVAAKDVYFHLPFLSIFSGSPVLTFKMSHPEVNVVKDRAGKMNVMTLVKKEPPGSVPTAAPAASGGGLKSLPGVVTSARLGVELSDANLAYTDLATDLVSKVEKLNVQVKDISLSRTMKIAVWADLDTRMGKLLSVKGPFRLTGEVAPTFQGTEFQSATLEMNADANGVAISASDLFIKKAGLATNAQAKLKVTMDSVVIERLEANFHNAKLTAKGGMSGLSKTEADPTFDFQFQSNDIAFGPWTELVPMLKDYQLEGSALMKGNASGTAKKPEYAIDLAAKNVKAAAPMLKAKPEFQAMMKIVTDQVKQMSLSMKAPGNQLAVNGSVLSFTRPHFEVAVTSTGLDLDQLIDLPKPAPKGKDAAPAAPAKTADGKPAPAADFDQMVDPLRKNEIAAAARGNIKFNLPLLKIHEVAMTEMNGVMTMKDLAIALDKFAVKMFGGSIQATFGTQLRPKTPTYRFSTNVANLSLQKAVESQFAFLKNTLLGTADFKMEGTGASFNPEPAKRNLAAKGSMKVANGSFATVDVGRLAADALNGSIAKAAEKLAALKGKKVNPPGNTEAAYESISSDFTIAGGKFNAPNFSAVSKPGKGIDLKGSTVVDITNYGLDASWEIIDTHNLTHARDISVTEQGVIVNNILAENGGIVKFPVKVTGTCFEPKINYTAVPEALAKVAFNNVARAAGDKVKAEASKAVEQQIQKAAGNAPPQVQQALKGLGKKLFGK